ncbi:hypothetical protein [Flavobacterium reichenbachii]|uniref:Lipoprotein n=1 Tax=Flavobacterium reichenbachii TaxID=362418 RepID=A0A085ZNI1_9FLAO|nr:hypothetical protein [Flavobacterium reichenbachii]KFF05995.1 hypothetical protein IW19_10880 [Flavobacterium reichenbachii]OXB14777.1 hypothetical protein B0A68_12060 [Flavobacterium reichenbachii]
MTKKINKILFTVIIMILLVSCKNTKQQLQEYVTAYNTSTAPSFRAENVSLTTARGYINDDKIELRFETNLEQNELNKTASRVSFPKLIKEMINKDQIPRQLIEEGVQFDVYFLADDNTVLDKEVLNGNSIKDFLK